MITCPFVNYAFLLTLAQVVPREARSIAGNCRADRQLREIITVLANALRRSRRLESD